MRRYRKAGTAGLLADGKYERECLADWTALRQLVVTYVECNRISISRLIGSMNVGLVSVELTMCISLPHNHLRASTF